MFSIILKPFFGSTFTLAHFKMSIKFRNSHIALIALLLLLFGNACSTKKNTVATRTFHYITSKYNYFFNANQSYKNAELRANEQYTYNYTAQLPVLLVGKPQVSSLVGGDMDRAVNKCTDLIRLHSITVKPARKRGTMTSKEKEFYNKNEYVLWAREAWLLIGKARVWKGAFPEAAQTFEYILLQFPNTPIWFESQVWLARISIINSDFVGAADRLRDLSNNRKYPKGKHYTHLLNSTWAEYYQRLNQTDKMVPYLKKSLETAPDKQHRIRYTFLLAQVQQQNGNYAEASKLFSKVIRMSPVYELNFNARLQLASINARNGKGKDLKRQLVRMTRDEKNRDYLDQIYYTLAGIERGEGNMDGAIEYYKLSAQKSINNSNQKGLSYLALADYYFAKPNYQFAQSYYDSSYNALDDTHPEYLVLEVKTKNLNRLVENLNIIQLEDSLQRVAKMPFRERDNLIAQLIAKVRTEEQKAREAEQEDRNRFNQFQQNQMNRVSDQQQGTGWYFYNQSTLSYGQAEFRMRWGQRRLEDNWRRKNKRTMLTEDPTVNPVAQTDTTGMPRKVIDNKSREFYLQDLPTTDSLLTVSNQRIEKAMLQVAEVYEKQLKDYNEAINAYERFVLRFPKSGYAPEVYYSIYQLANQQGKVSVAERNKQTLIASFPQSRQALMLTNPNFLEELAQRQREQELFYQKTFELFSSNNCIEALEQAKKGIEQYKGSDIVPKLHLISALCTGKIGSLSAYRDALAQVGRLFPGTPEAATANEYIALLRERELQLAQVVTISESQTVGTEVSTVEKFSQPEGEHLFVAVIPKRSPINQLKFNIISFNVDYFLLINLNVSNRELNENFDIILVEGFKKQDEAWQYYTKAIAEKELMGSLNPSDYSLFIISRKNFQTLTEDKSVADYLRFFRATYQ